MIKIIAVGKLTQKYLKEGIEHYQKQIPHEVVWVEVKDEKDQHGMEIEALRIAKHIKDQDMVIALAIEGKLLTSESFSKLIEQSQHHQGQMVFVIGGSYGLSETIKKRAQHMVSLSLMTFPHQLVRVMLMEQLYRGFAILKNHPYHK